MVDIERSIQNIESKIKEYSNKGLKIAATSSFQSQSLPLLHLLSKMEKTVEVLFIDTGFHFPETYSYLNQLESELGGLQVRKIKPSNTKIQQLEGGRFLYNTQPDYCCHINKVLPLKEALEEYDVWISGVRKDQTEFRAHLKEEQIQSNGQLKYHPMLDWTSKDVHQYIEKYQLPRHPLESKGYLSIGCMPCTRSALEDMQRQGRWYGRNKSECGIHLDKKA